MTSRVQTQSGSQIVLGIETSCDETAAAVVTRDASGAGRILSNVVLSQFDKHALYGGVVPEIAARAHTEALDHIVRTALVEANVTLADLSGIAASAGPGLIGGLIVGATTGKALALAMDKPFLAINHLEAHALTAGLTDGIRPPYLMLLVSGGHTQLLLVEGVGRYQRLATTIDDALGEAYDKTAKLLGLPMPGGPAVEQAALRGNASRFTLPRPMKGRADPNFSFAGLKTAVRHAAAGAAPLSSSDVDDLCASFQAAVSDSVRDRVRLAMETAGPLLSGASGRAFVVAGGVAANAALRTALTAVAAEHGFSFHAPPLGLCTDNGAMVAWAGAERLALGLIDGLDAPVKPRWPLDPDAVKARGAGVKA
ncbi:tRNA (adenosine(37)-N6)-threonylcarbamoyltransferase complex transferase subunit TsaD [Hyphomicrobium methylovorum]|uniref:tRNA (adenosine(37)-N6)-threonylcarbamoyltransferase complex transferase subunit TsaD n=1 Tax=Hyphomicrobium methylovorum TaxID=84 RepID=UPI0015E71F6B|nr:tRNA (adenosine(37)-N6)-threonylcarbamoyltransferase complex transferase subunit TsaD [Hyphomicrobium methylovorum]MBA2126341.1 tRNA (adenosine(37)-N6)-threonylcarbamoyltransferase complex transferase subunit TsaD [Hyphomicrobium methylovorum]